MIARGLGGPAAYPPRYCDVINFIYIIQMSATLCCTTNCGLPHCDDRWLLAESLEILISDPNMGVQKMKVNRDLIDPNFGGYKLSLAGVTKHRLPLEGVQRPEVRQPGASMYSFLDAKLCGEHNHLTGDPWSKSVYWVGEGGVHCYEGGEVKEVWELPSSDGVECQYNARLVFLGESEVAVSDGKGMIYILDTGKRGLARPQWKMVFSGDVCGRDRSFVVVGGMVRPGGGVEVVVQYVEKRERVEGVHLPKGEGEFLNCLDWISLSKEGEGLQMERVRRVCSPGGINYIAVVGGKGGEPRLVLSCEKIARIVFDSMNPIEEVEGGEVQEENENTGDAERAVFYWCQLGGEDLEIWLYVGEVVKSAVKVFVEGRRLSVEVRGVEMMQGILVGDVEQDSWTWSLQGGKLAVLLCKATPGPWPAIWGGEGGSKGEQVTELREDTVLANLTTDNPLANNEETRQPAFNSEQLEACDDCDTEDRLQWFGGGEDSVASLEGRQHLLTFPSDASSAPQLCTRHDVDGLVWRLAGGETAEHANTFPALGYVQASKQSRKFLAAPASARFSVICDSSRHLYLYRQPEALAAELGLRNRKSGERVERVARQQVITLEPTEEVLGLVAEEEVIHVLSATALTSLVVD